MRVSRLASALVGILLARPATAETTGPSGPRVITYRVMPGAPAPAVPEAPYLDLGGAATEAETFNWIVAVRRQASGRLLVATFDPIRIRVFDAQGHLTGGFGRKGQGPGEYLDVSDLVVLPSDSLVVLDRMQRRITVLGPDGKYAAAVSLKAPFASSPFDVSLQPLADGTLLIGYAEVTATRPSPQPVAVFQHVGRYGMNGVLRDSLGLFFTGEYFLQATPYAVGQGSAFWQRAFGRVGALVTADQSIFAGDASALEVRRMDLSGRVLEIHRLDVPTAALTPAMIARYRSENLAMASVKDRPVEEKRVTEMPYPDHLPAFRRLAIDAGGRLWLQQYIYPQPAPNRWWVLDPASRQARVVVLPDRFVPHVIGRTDIVGTWEDADDVEHVRAYRLLF